MFTLIFIFMFLIYQIIYITKIDMVYFHFYNIYTACSFFLSTQLSHSNKTVQQAVPLIATHIKDEALILIKKYEMQCWKGFKNADISIGLFFFERFSLITATMCANNFFRCTNARYLICIHTPSQL